MGSGSSNPGHQNQSKEEPELHRTPSEGVLVAPAISDATSISSAGTKRKSRKRPAQVHTLKESFLSRLGRLNHGSHKRRIRWTQNISEQYTLGPEVFPSTHQAMEVRHAMRIEDKMRLVVKIREKKGSFVSSQEEKDWRISTEFMMNIPKSGSIVQFIEVLEDFKNYYVIMEKAAGMDLFETLDIHGRLSISNSKEIIRQLVLAVAELHERGCIHKDLKLENVMVDRAKDIHTAPLRLAASSFHSDTATMASLSDFEPTSPSPVVKLIDFDTVEPRGCSMKHQQTSVVGTNQYISQEAYAGKYSPASDMFAVGVIAYRLLTGVFPFHSAMFDDVAGENWVGSPKMKQIRERLQHVDIDFSKSPFPHEPLARDLVQAMLATDEHDRPKAAEAVRHPWFASARLHRSHTDTSDRSQDRCTASPAPPGLIDN